MHKLSSVVVTEKYCIVQLPMIPFIDYTMIVGVVKTVGVVKCPDIHFQKLGNYECACGQWTHEDCVDEIVTDESGAERFCPRCVV